MDEFAFHPEDKARSLIDRRLLACGWLIQSKDEINLGVGLGVAVREFQTASGPVDYGLFVGRKLCGVIEAKPEGTTFPAMPNRPPLYRRCAKHLVREEGQVRFEYVASGTETLFRDHADPDPGVAPCLSFHRPETLERWLKEPLTLRGRLRAMPPFVTDGLRACQVDAVSALEASLAAEPSARAGADGDRRRQDLHGLHAQLPVARPRGLQAHPVPRRPRQSRPPDARRISRLSAARHRPLVFRNLQRAEAGRGRPRQGSRRS